MQSLSAAAPSSSACIASVRGLRAGRRTAAPARAAVRMSPRAEGAAIQFVKGTNETSVPDVRRSYSPRVAAANPTLQ